MAPDHDIRTWYAPAGAVWTCTKCKLSVLEPKIMDSIVCKPVIFDLKPNKTTIDAMQEAREGNLERIPSMDALFDGLQED